MSRETQELILSLAVILILPVVLVFMVLEEGVKFFRVGND